MTASASRTTTLVNIWAGPGAGKSTTAAETFAILKQAGVSCELRRIDGICREHLTILCGQGGYRVVADAADVIRAAGLGGVLAP